MTTRSDQSTFTPRELVDELDRYIVGQEKAKRAVAIALRNRWRRQQLPEDLRDDIAPKNIIMIGPTGVGKTEIARRLSKLVRAPFIKVEATKFTEVGYVGRDVDSMIRDLIDVSMKMVKDEEKNRVQTRADKAAEERLLDLLLPPVPRSRPAFEEGGGAEVGADTTSGTREKLRAMLRSGDLNERMVTVDAPDKSRMPMFEMFSGTGMEEMDSNFRDILGNIFPRGSKSRSVRVPEALSLLSQEEAEKMLDMDAVVAEAILRAEQNGIIFIDEIDKIAGRDTGSGGSDVSRQGVQRDILPIIEGSSVNTKHGMVRTDHILFIAAGAFHLSKPSDLVPELQGRFPIRVELSSLGREEFVRILTEPRNALISQYVAMMDTEGVHLNITRDSIEKLAAVAAQANDRMENIGARRLHTVMERLMDEISFDATDKAGSTLVIDEAYVNSKLGEFVEDEDLSRFIL